MPCFENLKEFQNHRLEIQNLIWREFPTHPTNQITSSIVFHTGGDGEKKEDRISTKFSWNFTQDRCPFLFNKGKGEKNILRPKKACEE
jgi:hypothetical protein